jgi:hypothetical protein
VPLVGGGFVVLLGRNSRIGASYVHDFRRPRTIEHLPNHHSTPLTDKLNRILGLLVAVTPPDATISFDFGGRLHVHIDVRRPEDITVLESVLPISGLGAVSAPPPWIHAKPSILSSNIGIGFRLNAAAARATGRRRQWRWPDRLGGLAAPQLWLSFLRKTALPG